MDHPRSYKSRTSISRSQGLSDPYWYPCDDGFRGGLENEKSSSIDCNILVRLFETQEDADTKDGVLEKGRIRGQGRDPLRRGEQVFGFDWFQLRHVCRVRMSAEDALRAIKPVKHVI